MTAPLARLVALALTLAAAAGVGRLAWTEWWWPGATRASDALPLYLGAAAAAAGDDPTRQEALAAAYDARGLDVGAATFSTLYPATAAALLRPLAALDWDTFTFVWRGALLAALVSFGVSGAGMLGREVSWERRLAWGAAIVAALAWHPVAAEGIRLGQVNLALGALCAAACAAIVGGREGGAAVLLAVGALIKLVPGAGLVALLVARRWWPLGAAAAVGGIGVLASWQVTPPLAFLEAIRGTLRFQASIDPDWLVGASPAPSWMRTIGWLRHDAMGAATLGALVIAPLLRPSPATAAGAIALLCAWLGADAAGFHVLYAPLAWPAAVWVSTGRPVAALLVLVSWFGVRFVPGVGAEPQMVLWGAGVWAIAAGRLAWDAARVPASALERHGDHGVVALAGVCVGLQIASAFPGSGPVAPPLPEGRTAPEGPGFIRPNDRVPGRARALGAGMDRAASTLARPGTIRGLQLHLRGAPLLWRAIAERYPARATFLLDRARAAPAGDLRDHSGRDIAAWLREEEAAVTQLSVEGVDVADLRASLDAALASGLTEGEGGG